MDKLSIIIPILNEAGSVNDCLNKLQPLRLQGHEVIAVDGCSSDSSAELARPLVDKLIFSNRSRSTQMNAGAQAANGTILVFLHIDTVLPHNADNLITGGLIRTDKCWGHFDIRLTGDAFLLRIVESLMNLRSSLTNIATGDQAIFVTRTAFDVVGGYPDIPLMEDIAISKRLKKISLSLRLKNRALTSSRRWEQHGVITTILFMWLLRLAYFSGASPDYLAKQYYRKKPNSQTFQYPNARLMIFSKTPQTGKTKTRLIPTLGKDGATALHAELLHHTIKTACSTNLCPVQIWYTHDESHPFWRGCRQDYSITLHQQIGDDLGKRMSHAIRCGLTNFSAIILIGTDCPTLSRLDLKIVMQKLHQGYDAVLGPAHDGGYVLIALTKHDKTIFNNIAWGTEHVLSSTRSSLSQLGWKWWELEAHHDIDTHHDLQRYRNQTKN